MNYRELIEREQGFSVSPVSGRVPTTGYMVSVPGHTRKIPLETFQNEDVTDYVRDLIPWGDRFVGGWVEDGFVWLDPSQNVESLDDAKLLGEMRNQIAIWDVVNKREIPTGGTGE